MEEIFLNQDYQIIIWIPLVLLTIKELSGNWRQVFDNDLTVKDRGALHRINIMFILPLVVLLHEIGHAVATIAVGGEVKELHFGIWYGWVLPYGNFSALDSLIITLAGNVVQIAIGFLFLIAAVFTSSPPVVALLVYSGIYAIGGTIIIYALLSWGGYYGDWVQIYSSPLKEQVFVIGVIHAIMVIFLLYLIYGTRPRIWFTGKTRPKWKQDNQTILEKVKDDPSAVNYLSLAWSYFFVGLYKLSEKFIAKAKELEKDMPDCLYLEGCISRNKGDYEKSIEHFEAIANNVSLEDLPRARALMAVGHCLIEQLPEADGSTQSNASHGNAVETFEQASTLIPEMADPLFYKSTIFNKVGLHKEAEIILKDLDNYKWLDPSLKAAVIPELKVARSVKEDNK